MRKLSEENKERAARIRLILLDVDGVLTDGRIRIGSDGVEQRVFHVRDGTGIRVGQAAGLSFGILSGRKSAAVERRAAELGISEVHQGVHDKLRRFEEILQRVDLQGDAVCFVGDDLIDIPVMRKSGFAAAPADAVPEAREIAHHVTELGGGAGAVREVVELVLRASGQWDAATRRYLKADPA